MPILLGLFIANRWGLEELAAFTVANATIAIATIVADWGAPRAVPRNLATLLPQPASRFLASATALRLLIVLAMFVLGLVAAVGGAVHAQVMRYLTVLFPLCVLSVVTTNGVSQRVVSGQTPAIGASVVAGLSVFVTLSVAAAASGRGPVWFVAAYVVGKIVEALVIAWGRWWTLAISGTALGSTAIMLWPFSAQMILGIVYSRLSVFTVERMTTRAELGVFSVALALQGVVLLLPTSLALLQFPELSRLAHRGDAGRMRDLLLRYTIVSGLGVVLGVASVALLIERIGLLFNVPQALAPFLIAYAALAFLTIFTMMAGMLMQARGGEALAARLSVVTLVLALVYQLASLEALGLWGIVPGTAATELTALFVFGVALRRSGITVSGDPP